MKKRLVYNGFQRGGQDGGFDLFTVDDPSHPRHRSTLAPRTLKALGFTAAEMKAAKEESR